MPFRVPKILGEFNGKICSECISYNLEFQNFPWGTPYPQGFQSGPVPGIFTRLRSCIVPAEITEPPKLAVVKTTSTMVDRLVEYFS